MNRDDILRKIKACLARANSDNPHEAEAALIQAKKLMEIHKLSMTDVEMSTVSEFFVKASGNIKPAVYESGLAIEIAEALGCKTIYTTKGSFVREYRYAFIGCSPNVELASYYFETLIRQLKTARQHYIKTQLYRCRSSQSKTSRADVFCEAWAYEVIMLVRKYFKHTITPEHKKLLDSYVTTNYANLGALKNKNRSNLGSDAAERAAIAGSASGRKVQLRAGVGQQSRNLLR